MVNLKKTIVIIMFAFIVKLFGCAEQTKQNSKTVKTDSFSELLSKSMEDFVNRPIHKVLTTQIIDTTSDDKLLQTVFDNLCEKLPKDYNKEYQTVLGWSKAQQAIYIIWWLEAEVNNGGYNQFYYNSSRQFAELAPAALKLVGALKFANLTERANEVYKKENEQIKKYQDGTLEGFSKSYEGNPLDKFDEEFYELYKKEELQEIQVAFIRNHKQDFIDK